MKKTFVEHDIRKDFPIFETYRDKETFIYLDSAATSFTPKVVTDAMTNYYHNIGATVHRSSYALCIRASSLYHETRVRVAEFIHAPMCEEVIFTSGTTDSLNKLARMVAGTRVKEGDDILIVETEHHANIVPWQMIAKEVGACIKVIAVDDAGRVDLEAYKKSLSSKTSIVAVAHVSNVTGEVHPIKEMAKLAHERGAWLVCDGAQAVAHMEVNVVDLGVDFYAFSSHKMYGPTGVGILWGKLNLLEDMEPAVGGGDMIESVNFEKTTYGKSPLKFEAGTPNIAAVIGFKEAIDYLTSFDREEVKQWEESLIQELKKGLNQIDGIRFHGDSRSGLLSFSIDGLHAFDIGMMLNLRGISVRTGHLCAMPALQRLGVEHVVRVSVAMYNTVEEIIFFNSQLLEIARSLQVQSAL
ncbi:cysteine desulfurase CsdA [Candidatus Aerophobetes bacterium]|uniref:Cysteine desulfurase n=1 Tax=Aerophobetes bacterium TaxID=2030807 RepID=A0A2A4X5D8_UNCAE|nr:MAG: cysteine desulfurase CsdA [Candidatus Aerophobetes bacterium]